MSDVRKVFVTSEVAMKFQITTAYLVRLAKKMNFDESEFRETQKHTYLFSEEAVDKLDLHFNGNKQK